MQPSSKTLKPSLAGVKKRVSKMEFKQAVNIILKYEGGYVNDPKDPGGETKYGISKRAYPNVDIAGLTKGHAKDIYQRDYWNACKCDGLPESLRLLVFDSAVNHGVGWASKTLQGLVMVKKDGEIGPKTLAAINEFNEEKLLERFLINRLDYYFSNRNFYRYGQGWLRRLLHVSVYTQR